MQSSLRLGLALLLTLLLGSCREPRPTRVVLVTLDTLRYDALVPESSAADGGESTMPHLLERVRNDGVYFERFFAATPVTQPSHVSMLTALHPWEHGVVSNGQVLEQELDTVAEVLRGRGFTTGAVVASFPVAARFGFGQGFDTFDDRFTQTPVTDHRWEGHPVPDDRFYSIGDTVTDRALALLTDLDERAEGSGDQFLWFHYFDPHDPWGNTGEGPRCHPGAVFRAIEDNREVEPLLRRCRKAYDRDVTFLDRQLDRLLRALEASSDRYETHVVLASDHGESFGEEGAIAHGKRLTDEQIRVPLVILSDRVESGTRRGVVGSVDVARTLLSLAGVDPIPQPFSRVRDLTSQLDSEDVGSEIGGARGMRRIFWNETQTELRTDGSRHPLDELLFYTVEREGLILRGNGSGLRNAPTAVDPEIAQRTLRLFHDLERRLSEGVGTPVLDEETQKALRALGYVE